AAQHAGALNDAQRLFGWLYRRHAAAVCAKLCVSASRSHVDDLAQETWLRAWKRLESFKTGSFRAWIIPVASNCKIDWQRKRRPDSLADDSRIADRPSDADDQSEHDSRAKVLRECLSKLDGRRRRVIEGLFYDASDYDAVCRDLGITANAAYK